MRAREEFDMATLTFDQVWEAVRGLGPEELHRLRNLVDTLLTNPALLGKEGPLTPEDEVDLALLKEGLLTSIPPPLTEAQLEAYQKRKPIQIEGEPLSETILRERW